MFKKIIVTFFFGVLLLGSYQTVLAQNTADRLMQQLVAAGETGANFAKPIDPRETVLLIIRYALSTLGFIFVLLTIYAGFLWMTAGGDESNIEKAKKILTASIIGLAIILLSYSITLFVFKVLTLEGVSFKSWNK